MRSLALTAALVGAICWVANLYADVGALSLAGTMLLGVAVLVIGLRLARQPWLGVVTSLGSVTLGWALLDLLRAGQPDRGLEASLGGLVGLLVMIAVARDPGAGPTATPTTAAGNHRA